MRGFCWQALKACLVGLLLAMPVLAFAQTTAVITGPKQGEPGDLIVLDASGSNGQAFRWVLVGTKKVFLPIDGGKRIVFAVGQPGEYTFVLVVGGQGQGGALEVASAEWTITVGNPVPPTPPTPPEPPSPFPMAGLRVMVLEETADRRSLPPQQLSILDSTLIRDYLKEKCLLEEGVPAFRFFDVSDVPEGQSENWKVAFSRVKATPGFKVPWLVVAKGKSAYSGPLPNNVEETLSILKRYGG